MNTYEIQSTIVQHQNPVLALMSSRKFLCSVNENISFVKNKCK